MLYLTRYFHIPVSHITILFGNKLETCLGKTQHKVALGMKIYQFQALKERQSVNNENSSANK